jgi:hypothetical protein
VDQKFAASIQTAAFNAAKLILLLGKFAREFQRIGALWTGFLFAHIGEDSRAKLPLKKHFSRMPANACYRNGY